MELAGLPLGLASEGSFGPDPMVGMFPWNVEFLIFIDDEQGLEIVGHAKSEANHVHLLTGDWAAAKAFARLAAFPAHHQVVRPEGENDLRLRKGIAAWTELEAAFAWAQAQSATGQVFLESDLRAHANPTRMENIRRAAEDLVARLRSLYPACGAPTRETLAEVQGCLTYAHRVTHQHTDPEVADPGRCDHCNL